MSAWYNKYAAMTLFAMLWMIGYYCVDWSNVEWPAWVQAIGSIAGIAIAIWVPYKQRNDAVKLESTQKADEVRRILIALRDDLLQEREALARPVYQVILSLEPREYFAGFVTMIDVRSTIFSHIIGRLPLIEDDFLRKKIINTYQSLDRFTTAAIANNGLLEEFGEVIWSTTYPKRRLKEIRIQSELVRLRDSGANLKERCRDAIREVNYLIPLLEERGAQVN